MWIRLWLETVSNLHRCGVVLVIAVVLSVSNTFVLSLFFSSHCHYCCCCSCCTKKKEIQWQVDKIRRLGSVRIQSSLLCWCCIDWFPCLEERSARCGRSFDCVDLSQLTRGERERWDSTRIDDVNLRDSLSFLSPRRLTVGSFCTTSQRWFKRIFSFTDQNAQREEEVNSITLGAMSATVSWPAMSSIFGESD